MKWWQKAMTSALVMAVVAAVAVVLVKVFDNKWSRMIAENEVKRKDQMQGIKLKDEEAKAYVEERVAELEKEDVDGVVERWKARFGRGT